MCTIANGGFKSDTNRDKYFLDNLNEKLSSLHSEDETNFEVLNSTVGNFVDNNELEHKQNCNGLTWESDAETLYFCFVKSRVKIDGGLLAKMANLELQQMHLSEMTSIQNFLNCTSHSKIKIDNEWKQSLETEVKSIQAQHESDFKWLNGFYTAVTNFSNH